MTSARGAIAAGHPVTAAVGAEVLRAGGSAVDACVAAAFASWIAEPALTGPGGGGFLVAYDAARRRPLAVDCFVAVPAEGSARGAVAPLEPYVVDFGTGQQVFLVGPGSCAVPGVTAGLEHAHRRLGRLPWGELTRPAVALAHAGVELTPAHADVIDLLEGLPGRLARGRAASSGPPDAPLQAGQITRNPALGDTLERIAAGGAARARRGRDGARDRRPSGGDRRSPHARRPGRLPRHPPPPAGAALPRAHLRHEPAAVLRRLR